MAKVLQIDENRHTIKPDSDWHALAGSPDARRFGDRIRYDAEEPAPTTDRRGKTQVTEGEEPGFKIRRGRIIQFG